LPDVILISRQYDITPTTDSGNHQEESRILQVGRLCWLRQNQMPKASDEKNSPIYKPAHCSFDVCNTAETL